MLEVSREARELYLSSEVPELQEAPQPLAFHRNWVAQNRPVIVRGGVSHWPAVHRWSPAYLASCLASTPVTVAVTPTGLADSPQGDTFLMPEERSMYMGDFLKIMDQPDSANGVFYIQKQNSNLTEEFGAIMGDIEPDISWATAAFDKKPDAVNFWMGDSRAVTSMHKDPYENIYCVVRGHKDITLQPPTDLPWLPYREYSPAVYREDRETGAWREEAVPGPPVPWIAVDPLKPDLQLYPLYRHSTVIRCRLEAGDVLYLPSYWFHHLSQSQGCIAVNYWYDMEFDIKYNYFNLLSSLKKMV